MEYSRGPTAENRKKIGRKNLCQNRGGLNKLNTETPLFRGNYPGRGLPREGTIPG